MRLSLLVFLFCLSANAAPTAKDLMLGDLDYIQQTFAIGYAPTQWKSQHIGWDLKKQMDTAKASLQAIDAPTVKDYRRIVSSFIASTQDYHVSVSFTSTESATLPIQIKGINGKYYLVWIDRTKLTETDFPYSLGDEVVELGGQPLDQLVQSLDPMSKSNAPTDQSIGEMFLTRRSGAMAMDVPKGPVDIKIKDDAGVHAVELVWEYTPEQVAPVNTDPAVFKSMSNTTKELSFENAEMSSHSILQLMATDSDKAPANPFRIAAKKSFIPQLGEKIWEADADNHFYAYIFQSPDKHLVGYIRIAAYDGGEKEANQFFDIVSRMQKTTDALIIDQINNPGGSIFYVYALASALTNQPLMNPQHRMSLKPSDIAEAAKEIQDLQKITNDKEAKDFLGNTIGGYNVNYEVAKFVGDYDRFRVSEWNAGRTLTNPGYLYINKIQPNPSVQYTKPILLLVNELDFSGGDFFPAIMQDNNRVKILGTRTAGAGGYIQPNEFPNLFGIAEFVVTGSIAVRNDANKSPIENLGVTPDIAYQFVDDDAATGFIPYGIQILKTVMSMIGG